MTLSVTGLILCIGMYPCVFLMYFLLKNEAETKKGIYYGVTVPKEYRGALEIKEITAAYHKQMKKSLWIMLVFPIPSLFLPWESIVVAVWMLWMAVAIIIFFVPFGIANGKMKEIKYSQGWQEEVSRDTEVELKSAGEIRRVKWFHHILQCVTSVILVIWVLTGDFGNRSQPLGIMMITFAGVSFLFWGLSVWQDRQKTQIISSDSDVNVNYSRANKNLFKNFWVLCSWVNVAYMIWMLFCVDEWGSFTGMLWWATAAYIAVTIVLAARLVKKKSSLDETYDAKRNRLTGEDHDENWIWGMMYYNPKDKHSMVEKRVGVGTSINMATPVGKGCAAIFALTMLSFPIISIWIIMMEFTPIQMYADENRIVANHLREEYVISMPAIEKAELISELPKMSRNSGTAMETLRKGSWSVREEGNCSVFLDPRNEVFLYIETPSSRYYLSGCDDAETQAVYDAVKRWQEKVDKK